MEEPYYSSDEYDDRYDFNSCIKDGLSESFYSLKKEEQNEEENSIKITEAENKKNIENSQNMEGFQKRSNNTIIKIENNKIIGDEKNNINSINSSFKNDILENEDFMEDIQKNEINFNKIKNINTIGLKSEIKKTENSTNILKKKRGRNCTRLTGGVHNKYSDDNLRRKCKHLVLKSVFNFINEKIRIIYDNHINQGLLTKQLLTINQKQISDATILFNKNFLYKSLKDIFSVSISSRYTNYLETHNKTLINFLMKEEEDENKKEYFNGLFNLRFIDCLEQFRGTADYFHLDGLTTFDEIKSEFEKDKNYLDILTKYIFEYENITMNKKGRLYFYYDY
jgi:hypothetical protein